MKFSEVLSDVRRIVEDDGLRWSDRVIAQYLARAVNRLYRKTKQVSAERSFTVPVGENISILSGADFVNREITSIRCRQSSGTSYFLEELPIADMPKDTTSSPNGPAKFFAVSHAGTGIGSDGTVVSENTRVIIYPPSDDASAEFQVNVLDQWSFVSDEDATSVQEDADIPIKDKYNIDVINFVSGSLLLESNDQAFVEKGRYYLSEFEKSVDSDMIDKGLRKSSSQKTAGTYLFSDLLSDVRRIVENKTPTVQTITDQNGAEKTVKSEGEIVFDAYGRRWDDMAVAQYAVDGVNLIYRMGDSVNDNEEVAMASGTNSFSLTGVNGKVHEIRSTVSGGGQVLLQRIQLSEIPTIALSGDPKYYALTKTSIGGSPSVGKETKVVVYPTPNRTDASGFSVTYSREWEFVSNPVATATQMATEIPLESRQILPLVHYVAGNLLMECSDSKMIEKGQFYFQKAKADVSELMAPSRITKSTGVRASGVLTFSDVLSDVRRIIENQTQQDTENKAIFKNYGRRWDDRVISQYTQDSVNMIYRSQESVSDTVDVATVNGTSEYVLSNINGRIIEVRYTAQDGQQIVLEELQLTEIPTVGVTSGDPRFFALTKVNGLVSSDSKLVLYPTPNTSDADGIKVTYEKEWEFIADPTANITQLETQIPLQSRYHVVLTNNIVASLLFELSDELMIQKGQYFVQKVKEDLKELNMPKKVARSSGKRVGIYMTLGELITDVRRIVENQVQLDGKSTANMKDYGRRWDDRVISQYARKGVNHIYRKTGSVSDQVALNMVQGQDIYTFSTRGRIIKVEVLPENAAPAIVLHQIQFSEVPTIQNNQADPEFFSITQSVEGGYLQGTQDLVVYPTPKRTATGAIVITYAMEWDFYSDPTATAAQLDTEVPILPKFEMDLVHYVAGNLLLEMGDRSLAQKGQFYLQKAEQEIGSAASVNSLSYWNNQPDRYFP